MTSKKQKTSKDSKGVSLACNPVEVAKPVVAHINSTAYPEGATNTGSEKDAFLLLQQKKRHVDAMHA